MVPDEPVVDLDDAGAALVHDELGVTGPEPDSQSFQLAQYLWRLRGGAVHSRRSSTKKGGGESVVRNDPSTRSSRPSPSVSRVWRCPGRYSSATRGSLRRAAISSTRAASSPASCTRNTSSLATLPRLDHQRKGRVGRYLEGVRGEDRVDGREMPPQERLVLRAGRGAPVLGGQPEVRGGQGGGRLEEVAVGEDGRGLPVDAGDDVPEVGDVALDDRSVERMGAGTVGEKRHIEAGRAAAGRNPCVTESVALPGDQVERGGHDRPFQSANECASPWVMARARRPRGEVSLA